MSKLDAPALVVIGAILALLIVALAIIIPNMHIYGSYLNITILY
jgi:hypothetical protein